jgi:enoyl-CoA hydratase/carnithine racemase
MGWSGQSGHIEVSAEGGIALLLLNRPDKLNALSVPMLKDVGEAIRHFGSGSEAKALVITGAGRAFSAGDDLPATESLTRSDFDELLSSFQQLTRDVLTASVPVVAALNGIAVGGAAELTLACDARVGYPKSDYLFPENDVGLAISNGSTYLLPKIVGSNALPLVLDGRRVSGTEARDLGIINYFVDSQDDVVPKAREVVSHWVHRGLATPYHLRLLRPSLDEIEAAIKRENEIGREAWEAGTATKGIQRFLREQEERRAKG